MQRKRITSRIARGTAVALLGALLPVLATTTPASAAPTQGIVGTVTESGTGAALPGTWVLATSSTSFDLIQGTIADSAGVYGLDLPTGDYRVEFVEPSSSHAVEWYDNHGFDQPATAEILTVVADETITADVALDVPTGTLSGTITEQGTGNPIPDAWAAIMNSTGQPVATVIADAEGAFTIPSIDPGNYRLAGMDPTGAHELRLSPSSQGFDDAAVLTVTPGSSLNADIAMPAATPPPATSTISGTVTDDVSNAGVSGLWAVALSAGSFSFTAGALTDAAGDYSIAVPEGDYYLQFFDPSRGHRFEWYGNQESPDTAAELIVVADGDVANAAVGPVRGDIAGTITADSDSSPVAGAWVAALGANDGQPVAGVVADAEGNYRISGLSEGDYTLVFADSTGVHALEYYDNAASPDNAGLVSVTGGNTTTIDAGLA